MLWWIAAALVWLLSAVGIFVVMADVFRRKTRAFSAGALLGYGFRGVTAILVLWLIMKALA